MTQKPDVIEMAGQLAFNCRTRADVYLLAGKRYAAEITAKVSDKDGRTVTGEAFASLGETPILGRMVDPLLLQSLIDIAGQVREAHQLTMVSINLEPGMMSEASVQTLEAAGAQNWLWLEITEREDLRNRPTVVRWLQHLRQHGYRLLVDDVGSDLHADPRYLAWLLAKIMPHGLKLDLSLGTQLAHGHMALRAVNLIRPLQPTFDSKAVLIIEGHDAPENPAWRNGRDRLQSVWPGKILEPERQQPMET